MKKISTAATKQMRNFSSTLTIGLDLGDRSSYYCVLDERGEIILEQKVSTTQSPASGVRSHAAQSHRAGDRDALALGKSVAERVGA